MLPTCQHLQRLGREEPVLLLAAVGRGRLLDKGRHKAAAHAGALAAAATATLGAWAQPPSRPACNEA